jgi:hypothetical protein
MTSLGTVHLDLPSCSTVPPPTFNILQNLFNWNNGLTKIFDWNLQTGIYASYILLTQTFLSFNNPGTKIHFVNILYIYIYIYCTALAVLVGVYRLGHSIFHSLSLFPTSPSVLHYCRLSKSRTLELSTLKLSNSRIR